MAGWHVNNEPFTLAISHSFERFGHLCMMSATNEVRPHLVYELHVLIAGFVLLAQLDSTGQLLQNLGFLLWREVRKTRNERFQLCLYSKNSSLFTH